MEVEMKCRKGRQELWEQGMKIDKKKGNKEEKEGGMKEGGRYKRTRRLRIRSKA